MEGGVRVWLRHTDLGLTSLVSVARRRKSLRGLALDRRALEQDAQLQTQP